MKEYDNAFPCSGGSFTNFGITVRDYIAIQIATGLSANPDMTTSQGFDEIADMAYLQADALIERSNHEPVKKD